MLKNFFFLSLILVLTGNLSAQNNNTLLWKIEKKGMPVSYLYGSMHVKNAKAFDFADSVLLAFNSCKSIALEIHPDSFNLFQITNIEKSINRKFYGLDQNLDINLARKIEERLQKESGISFNQIKNKNPKYIKHLLSETEVSNDDKHVFLDLYLYDLALGENKKVYGLESLTSSYKALEKFKPNLQEQFEVEIDFLDRLKSIENLIDLYQNNQLEEIHKIFEDSTKIKSDYKKALLDHRNHIMVNSIDTIFSKQSCFFIMGCAHLLGEEGVIKLLQNKGYKVTPVSPKKSGLAKTYPLKFSEPKYSVITDETSGYSAEFMGVPYPMQHSVLVNKLYCSNEIIKDLVYFSVSSPLALEFQNLSKEKLYQTMLNKIKNERKAVVTNSKKRISNGIEGLEASLELKNINFKIFMLEDNGYVYLLMIGGKNDKLDFYFNRFINSLKIIPKSKTKSEEFISKIDAFKVNFPSTPTKNVTPFEEDDYILLRTYVSNNLSTNTTFLIQVSEYTGDYYIANEKNVLQEYSESILADYDKKTIEFNDFVSYKGLNTWKIIIKNKISKTEMLMFCKLNRVFLIFGEFRTENQQEMQDFVNSFEFINYEPAKFTLIETANKTSFLIPENYTLNIDSGNQESGIKKNYTYTAKDLNSSALYKIYHDTYSTLTQKDTSYIREIINSKIPENCTVLDSIVDITQAGFNSTLSFKLESNLIKSVYVQLNGNELFSFEVYHDFDTLNRDLSKFFKNIKIVKSKNQSLFEHKKNILLSQLKNQTLPSDEIAQGIYDAKWVKNDYPLLKSYVSKTYLHDTLYLNINSSLLSVLDTLNTSQFLQDSKEIYSKLNSNGKLTLLNSLIKLKSDSSLNIFSDLLLKDTSTHNSINWWHLNNILVDSSNLLQYVFPKILPILNHKTNIENLAFLIENLLDKKLISSEILNSYKDKFVLYTQKSIDSALYKLKNVSEDEWYYFPYWISKSVNIIYTMNWQNEDFNNKILFAEKNANSKEFSSTVVVNFLIKNLNLPKELKNKVFADTQYFWYMYFKLQEHNLTHLLPKKLQDYKELAKSDLLNYSIEFEEYTPDKIEFLSTEIVEFKNQKLQFYTFVIKSKYDGITESYFAISGGFEPNNFTKGKKEDYTSILWEDWNTIKKTPKSVLIERILNEYYNY